MNFNTTPHFQNKTKHRLLQVILVGVAVLYVTAPLQKELLSALHFVSHTFDQNEMPHSHHEFNSLAIEQGHSHESVGHQHVRTQHIHEIDAHDHPVTENHHTHQVLEFITALFQIDKTTDSSDTLLVEKKLDKHIRPLQISSNPEFAVIRSAIAIHYSIDRLIMNFDVLTPPPKLAFDLS